jgi:hypothetical protein
LDFEFYSDFGFFPSSFIRTISLFLQRAAFGLTISPAWGAAVRPFWGLSLGLMRLAPNGKMPTRIFFDDLD